MISAFLPVTAVVVLGVNLVRMVMIEWLVAAGTTVSFPLFPLLYPPSLSISPILHLPPSPSLSLPLLHTFYLLLPSLLPPSLLPTLVPTLFLRYT
jgi:hypothetical protein